MHRRRHLRVVPLLNLRRQGEQVKAEYPSLATTDLDGLIERAQTQKAILEHERRAAGRDALVANGEPDRSNPYSDGRSPAGLGSST